MCGNRGSIRMWRIDVVSLILAKMGILSILHAWFPVHYANMQFDCVSRSFVILWNPQTPWTLPICFFIRFLCCFCRVKAHIQIPRCRLCRGAPCERANGHASTPSAPTSTKTIINNVRLVRKVSGFTIRNCTFILDPLQNAPSRSLVWIVRSARIRLRNLRFAQLSKFRKRRCVPVCLLKYSNSLKGLFAAEDWACTKCGNVNWARRNTCNMCNAPKVGDLEKRTGYGGGYMERYDVEYIHREVSQLSLLFCHSPIVLRNTFTG